MKKILSMILVLTMVFAATASTDAASKPAKVKSISCYSAATTRITIKYSKVRGAKNYQVRYRQVGNKKWKYKKFNHGMTLNTSKTRVTIKKLKKATNYQIQIRGIRKSKKGQWATRKFSTPYIKVTAKFTNGSKASGVSFAAKNLKTGKTYTGKTNSKGYTKIAAPVGKYKLKWKSGYVSKTKALTVSIPKGKYKAVNWIIAKDKGSSSTESIKTDTDDNEYLGYNKNSFFMNNTDSPAMIEAIVNYPQNQNNNINSDLFVFPWVPRAYDDNGNPRTTDPLGEIVLNHAKTKYGITSSSSDFDKIEYVAQSVCDCFVYDRTQSGYINGKIHGVCASYSMRYQYALNKLGVPCYSIDSDIEDHAWNIVKLNGKYYYVDTTWMDSPCDGTQYYDRDYEFLKSNYFYNTHFYNVNDKKVCLPTSWPIKCTDTTYDEYDWSSHDMNLRTSDF